MLPKLWLEETKGKWYPPLRMQKDPLGTSSVKASKDILTLFAYAFPKSKERKPSSFFFTKFHKLLRALKTRVVWRESS